MLVAEIFLLYGYACGAVDSSYAQATLPVWREVIETLLEGSDTSAQNLEVGTLAKAAIQYGLTAGTLRIASDISSFAVGSDGFYDSDRLWMQKQSFDRTLRQFCAAEAAACVGIKSVLPELYQRGLIVRDEENGKNSYLKRSPEIPALGKRLRMLAFVRTELDREE